MSGNRDERIRERAHEIWDREGKPEGAAQRHWVQAEQEIGDEEKKTAKKPAAKKPAIKKPAAKSAAKAATASAKTTGAGAALAKRSKDAKKPTKA
jgi:hypothetical protein